jgi:hypothetical protein
MAKSLALPVFGTACPCCGSIPLPSNFAEKNVAEKKSQKKMLYEKNVAEKKCKAILL